MKRLGYAGLLFLIGCVLAGVFGMLHNQISYAVSPEYFTQFMFHQFDINPMFTDRAGAAFVGFLASWWMGFLISIFVVPVAMVFREPKQFFAQTLKAFVVVALTALLTGLIALIVSYFTIDESSVAQYHRIVGTTAENVAFLRAGMMHNFSYLGGIFGIITAITYLLLTRYVFKRNKVNKILRNTISEVKQKKKPITLEKYRKLIRILFVLITIRILCFAYILYQGINDFIVIFNTDRTFFYEIRIIMTLVISPLFFIVFLDILTLWKIKKEKIS
ncbi:MAG: hypothetical protein K8S87_10650, partial [Planctomycetes bacterium]|nr:hypothetical protein [Planctomycetota bacterium]